jgi:hypothetical protein
LVYSTHPCLCCATRDEGIVELVRPRWGEGVSGEVSNKSAVKTGMTDCVLILYPLLYIARLPLSTTHTLSLYIYIQGPDNEKRSKPTARFDVMCLRAPRDNYEKSYKLEPEVHVQTSAQ